MRGSATLKGDLLKAVQYDCVPRNVSADQPKDVRQGNVCKHSYFMSAEDEQYFKSGVEKEFVAGKFYIFYVCKEGQLIIAPREFVNLRTLVDLSADGKRKFAVVTTAFELTTNIVKKAVRATCLSYNLYEEKEEGSFYTEHNYHVDPAGNIPAILFNQLLEGQADLILDINKALGNQ